MPDIPQSDMTTLIGVLYGAAIVLIGALVSLALAWINALRRRIDHNTDLTEDIHRIAVDRRDRESRDDAD